MLIWFVFNPKYAIELSQPKGRSGTVFRSKIRVNQPLCSSYVFNHPQGMLCIHNSLILCSFESHNEIYRIIRVQKIRYYYLSTILLRRSK